MRTLFFAQSDDAVRLAASLGCGLLIGGMTDTLVRAQIQEFEDDPNALLVATMAFCENWRVSAEAHVFFLIGYPGPILRSIERVKEPTILPPTVQQLKQHAAGEITVDPRSLRTLYRDSGAVEPDQQDVLGDGSDYDITPLGLPAPDDTPDSDDDTDLEPYAPDDGSCPAPLRQSDEYYCVKCHIRWSSQEDKPPCQAS